MPVVAFKYTYWFIMWDYNEKISYIKPSTHCFINFEMSFCLASAAAKANDEKHHIMLKIQTHDTSHSSGVIETGA